MPVPGQKLLSYTVETISAEHFSVIPYLDHANLHGRVVNLMPLWDGVRWYWWVPSPAGLIDIRPAEAFQVDYVAKAPARSNDLLIPFVETMWQYLTSQKRNSNIW
jgi:hypothetical protein